MDGKNVGLAEYVPKNEEAEPLKTDSKLRPATRHQKAKYYL